MLPEPFLTLLEQFLTLSKPFLRLSGRIRRLSGPKAWAPSAQPNGLGRESVQIYPQALKGRDNEVAGSVIRQSESQEQCCKL
jgi:hypothetical protein